VDWLRIDKDVTNKIKKVVVFIDPGLRLTPNSERFREQELSGLKTKRASEWTHPGRQRPWIR
jgi:hypothetical protein